MYVRVLEFDFSFLFSSLRAEIWWQMVVVIAGVDRISLSTGMKLMAREWYGHARHPAKFHDSVMRREPFGACPPRFRYIPGITYRPFRRTSMSATQLRIPCIWLRCIACMYTLRRGELFERYREGERIQWWMPDFPRNCARLFFFSVYGRWRIRSGEIVWLIVLVLDEIITSRGWDRNYREKLYI